MKVRKFKEKDFGGIMDIVKQLNPKWFDNVAVNKSIPTDLIIQKGFVAQENDKIIGFLIFTSDEGKVKISWMGVEPRSQGKSVGTKLIEFLEKKLKSIGLKELRVETLAESIAYEPYEKTRLFYKKRGFEVEKVRKIKSEDNGEILDLATLVKKL